MLKRRVVTAAVALPVLLAAVYFGGYPFAALTAVAAAVGAWELCRMSRARGCPPVVPIALALSAGCAAAEIRADGLLPMAAVLAGMAVSAPALVRGFGGGGWIARSASTLAIALFVGGAMFHAAALRNAPDGLFWTLFALAATFATDTGAYFVGRAFGSRKLAPTVSPNKTWEGAIGGLLAAAAVGAILGAVWANGAPPPGIYTRPAVPPALIALATGIAGAILSVAGQFGDLYISKLKRKAGFDDSGAIFPGHGGILDRMDSLMLSVTAAAYLRAASVWALAAAGG